MHSIILSEISDQWKARLKTAGKVAGGVAALGAAGYGAYRGNEALDNPVGKGLDKVSEWTNNGLTKLGSKFSGTTYTPESPSDKSHNIGQKLTTGFNKLLDTGDRLIQANDPNNVVLSKDEQIAMDNRRANEFGKSLVLGTAGAGTAGAAGYLGMRVLNKDKKRVMKEGLDWDEIGDTISSGAKKAMKWVGEKGEELGETGRRVGTKLTHDANAGMRWASEKGEEAGRGLRKIGGQIADQTKTIYDDTKKAYSSRDAIRKTVTDFDNAAGSAIKLGKGMDTIEAIPGQLRSIGNKAIDTAKETGQAWGSLDAAKKTLTDFGNASGITPTDKKVGEFLDPTGSYRKALDSDSRIVTKNALNAEESAHKIKMKKYGAGLAGAGLATGLAAGVAHNYYNKKRK